MECKKVSAGRDTLLDPLADVWSTIPGESMTMAATPLANQPSMYIQASRDEKKIGKVRSLMVQAAHNGSDVFFRLSWADDSENRAITDTFMFPDGCGVLLPLAGGDPPIDEMGNRDAPVNGWFWRADMAEGEAKNTVAKGLGTTEFFDPSPVSARAAWGQGAWAVVFARRLALPAEAQQSVQLAPGATVKIGFAVWEGSNGERAGVKAFSKEWRPLALEA